MKNTALAILIASILLLSACAENTNQPVDLEKSNKPDLVEVSKDTTETEKEEEVVIEEETPEEVVEESDVEVAPIYELSEANWTIKPISDANPKGVLLTIDDAPDKNALEMAKTLKELNAPAIFFVNGHFIDTEEEKSMLKEIHEMGFPIGNHTYSHPTLKQISEEKQFEEIVKLNDAIEEIIGERPEYFRAPFGINTDYVREITRDEGMLLMNWTYGYDWEKQYMDSAALADIMVNTPYLTDGAILLMHDRVWTAGALKDIVEGLRGNGYELIDPISIKGIEIES